jgi:hypothetical protein
MLLLLHRCFILHWLLLNECITSFQVTPCFSLSFLFIIFFRIISYWNVGPRVVRIPSRLLHHWPFHLFYILLYYFILRYISHCHYFLRHWSLSLLINVTHRVIVLHYFCLLLPMFINMPLYFDIIITYYIISLWIDYTLFSFIFLHYYWLLSFHILIVSFTFLSIFITCFLILSFSSLVFSTFSSIIILFHYIEHCLIYYYFSLLLVSFFIESFISPAYHISLFISSIFTHFLFLAFHIFRLYFFFFLEFSLSSSFLHFHHTENQVTPFHYWPLLISVRLRYSHHRHLHYADITGHSPANTT